MFDLKLLYLKEQETDTSYLLLSQNFMAVSLLIHLFCTSCEPKIVLPVLQTQNKTNFMFTNYTKRKRIDHQNLAYLKKPWIRLTFFLDTKKSWLVCTTHKDFQTVYEGI